MYGSLIQDTGNLPTCRELYDQITSCQSFLSIKQPRSKAEKCSCHQSLQRCIISPVLSPSRCFVRETGPRRGISVCYVLRFWTDLYQFVSFVSNNSLQHSERLVNTHTLHRCNLLKSLGQHLKFPNFENIWQQLLTSVWLALSRGIPSVANAIPLSIKR